MDRYQIELKLIYDQINQIMALISNQYTTRLGDELCRLLLKRDKLLAMEIHEIHELNERGRYDEQQRAA